MNDDKFPEDMTREELIAEVEIAWRYLWATGRNAWPTEAEFMVMENAQDEMRKEYDAENARDPQ